MNRVLSLQFYLVSSSSAGPWLGAFPLQLRDPNYSSGDTNTFSKRMFVQYTLKFVVCLYFVISIIIVCDNVHRAGLMQTAALNKVLHCRPIYQLGASISLKTIAISKPFPFPIWGWQICQLPLSSEGSNLFSFRGAWSPYPRRWFFPLRRDSPRSLSNI